MKTSLHHFKHFSFLVLFLISVALQAQETLGASITREKSTFDFGDIQQGDKVHHTFKFINSGKEPLMIFNVEVTCGCTLPKSWPRNPVMQGGKGELEIQFNSSGKIGLQHKVITVISNSVNGNSQVTFTANVLGKKEY